MYVLWLHRSLFFLFFPTPPIYYFFFLQKEIAFPVLLKLKLIIFSSTCVWVPKPIAGSVLLSYSYPWKVLCFKDICQLYRKEWYNGTISFPLPRGTTKKEAKTFLPSEVSLPRLGRIFPLLFIFLCFLQR